MKNIPSGQIQLGSGGAVSPPAGPGDKAPGSSEEPAIYTTCSSKKIHSRRAFF